MDESHVPDPNQGIEPHFSDGMPIETPLEDLLANQQEQPDHNKAKNALRLGLVTVAGGVSNAAWVGSIFINRVLEETDTATTMPAVGFALGSTAIEYGLSYAATAGDINTKWEPKRRITRGLKKILSSSAFLVSSWRGAAGGMYIDQLSGREPTKRRRLAHAATYGFFMGVWISEAGSKVMEFSWNALQAAWDFAGDNQVSASVIATGAIALGAYGLGKTEEKIQ